MNEPRIAGWVRRHLRWLLWLALLLPAAQLAGTVHLLSHLATAGQARGQDAGHPAECPICPLAAALAVGGAPSSPPALQLDLAAPALRVQAVPGRAAIALLRPFDSRGPPSLLR